jgi:hypothetical protein
MTPSERAVNHRLRAEWLTAQARSIAEDCVVGDPRPLVLAIAGLTDAVLALSTDSEPEET